MSPLSQSWRNTHQTDSMKEASIVKYGCSMSTQRPTRRTDAFHSWV